MMTRSERSCREGSVALATRWRWILLRDYRHDLSLVSGNVVRSGREDGVRIWLLRVGGRYR